LPLQATGWGCSIRSRAAAQRCDGCWTPTLMAFATHVFIQNTHDCCVVAASSTAKHFAFMYLCHPSAVVV